MKKIILWVLIIFLFPIQGCSSNTVKWLIHSSLEQEDLIKLENRINDHLDNMDKNYIVKLYSYGYEETYEDIIQKAKVNNIDIINLLSVNNDTPNSYILRLIYDGYCEEVDNTYNNYDLFLYNDKLYGYGNVSCNPSVGIYYTTEYVDSIHKDISELNTEIVIDDDVIEYGKNHSNFVNIGMVTDNLYTIDDLFYVDLLNHECGYLYDHKDIKNIYEVKKMMVQSGYAINPELFGSPKEEPGFANAISEEYFKDINQFEYSSFYDIECVFKRCFYQYNHINVNDIENIIYKNSKNKENANDFLNELYSNRDLCNVILYGEESPELKDNYSYKEYIQINSYYDQHLCNETLVDNPYGWNIERKQKALDDYNKQYDDLELNGFVFELDKELLDIYNTVMNVFLPNGSYSSDSLKLNNMSPYYDEAWNRLKKEIKDNGGDQIVNELQKQVNEFIHKKEDNA